MSQSVNNTIYGKFQEQVEKNYDRPALSDEKAEYTYGQLSAYINSMAALLLKENTGKNDVVAVIYKRSAAAVIAMFAILKIGAVYMPDVYKRQLMMCYVLHLCFSSRMQILQ